MTSKGVAGTICGCLASGGGGAGAATCLKSSPKPGPSDEYDLRLQNVYQQADSTDYYFDFGKTNCVNKFFQLDELPKDSTTAQATINIDDNDVVTFGEACFVFDISHDKADNKDVVAAKFELAVLDRDKSKGVAIQTVLTNAQASQNVKLVYVTRVSYLNKPQDSTTWVVSKGFEFKNTKFPANDPKNLTISLLGHWDKMKVSGDCDNKCALGSKSKKLRGFFVTTDPGSKFKTQLHRAVIERDGTTDKGMFFGNEFTDQNKNKIEVQKVYDGQHWKGPNSSNVLKNPVKIDANSQFTWDQKMWGSFNDVSSAPNMTYQVN